MELTRYEPWSLVSQLQHEINRVFGNMVDPESTSATAQWVPAVDVREYSDHFEILADVPGVDPKQVEITLDSGMLTLSGERREEQVAQRDGQSDGQSSPQQQRRERHLGRFHRRFVLPDTADAEKVTAAGRDGVLAITIPKHPQAQPRRISVN